MDTKIGPFLRYDQSWTASLGDVSQGHRRYLSQNALMKRNTTEALLMIIDAGRSVDGLYFRSLCLWENLSIELTCSSKTYIAIFKAADLSEWLVLQNSCVSSSKRQYMLWRLSLSILKRLIDVPCLIRVRVHWLIHHDSSLWRLLCSKHTRKIQRPLVGFVFWKMQRYIGVSEVNSLGDRWYDMLLLSLQIAVLLSRSNWRVTVRQYQSSSCVLKTQNPWKETSILIRRQL